MSEQIPGAVGGVVPRIPRGRTDEFTSGPLFSRSNVGQTEAERLRETRIVWFSAGVVAGVGWMLLVVAAAVAWS